MTIIVIIAAILITANTACGRYMNTTKCLKPTEDTTTVQLTCDTAEMILITNEYKGKTRSIQENYCNFPKPDASDCQVRTENFVKSCSTFSTCGQSMKYDHLPSCTDYKDGHVYMHIDYQCIKRKQDEENSGDIPWAVMSKQDDHSGENIFMMSSGYASWANDTLAYCTVSVPRSNALTITIYDFTARHNGNCISWLQMTGQTKTCANVNWVMSSLVYEQKDNERQIDIILWSYEKETSRLWMQLQSDNGGSLEVQCGLDASSFSTPSTQAIKTTKSTKTGTTIKSTTSSTKTDAIKTTAIVTTTTTEAQKSTDNEDTANHLIALIAGVVAGGVVILIIIIILAVFIARKKKTKEPEREVIDAWKSSNEHMVTMPEMKSNGKVNKHNEDYTIYNNETYDQVGGHSLQQQTSFEEGPTQMYAQPTKKKRPQPIYDNAALVRNDEEEAVYGYSRELP